MKDLIATFDLETTNLNGVFGVVLCAVIKPWGGETTTFRIDHKPYRGKRNSDDSYLVKTIVDELSQYKILIAHNGVNFDRPYLNTRALLWGIEPLNPRGMMVDPVKVARRHLRFGYNSLDRLAQFLNTNAQKSAVLGPTWVKAAMDRDRESMDYIVEHCVADVLALEEVAMKLMSFVPKINEWGSS